MKQTNRIISLMLCAAMVAGYFPAPAHAEDLSQSGLCVHHPEHTDCAYGADMACDYFCTECNSMDAAITCPVTVATAAPATSRRGIPNMPKIRMGSRIILMMAPVS